MSTYAVNTFYYTWFTIVDPTFTTLGILGGILLPETTLKSYTPHIVIPPAKETVAVLRVLSGFFTALFIIQLFLRQRRQDLALFQAVQAATLAVDLTMLYVFYDVLSGEARLSLSTWRPEEWINIGITGTVTVIRMLFLAQTLGGKGNVSGRKKVA